MATVVSKPLVSERVLTIIFTLFLIYKLIFLLTSSSVMKKGPIDLRAEALCGEVHTTLARGKVSASSLGLAVTNAQPKVSAKKTPLRTLAAVE